MANVCLLYYRQYNGIRKWAPVSGGRLLELLPDRHLSRLTAAVLEFQAAPREHRHPAELGEDLVQLRHLCDLLEMSFAQRAVEFDNTDQAEREGSTTPGDWIRHNCKMAGHAVEKALCVGTQETSLQESTAALENGKIGFQHLALIASTARALRESSTSSGFDEHTLVEQARHHSVGRFRHDCAHARHAADAKSALTEHIEFVEARRLELLARDDGAFVVRGFLDSVGGATLRTALEPLARRSGVDDVRCRGKRLTDALVELAGHALDTNTLPSRNGQRPHLQVTATVDTLRGVDGAPAAELEFAGPVPAATAQRLACDAGVSRVLFNQKSVVVDVGRAARIPAGATRRALHARDRGCVWPGCDRQAAWTSAHHVQHWARNGPTNLENLVLICYRHHWMVHEGGWELVRRADGGIGTIPPVPRTPLFTSTRAPDSSSAA